MTIPAAPGEFLVGKGIPSLHLFVYGHLLPGAPMHDQIEAYVQKAEPAMIREHSLHWHAFGRFPIAVPNQWGTIEGQVLTLRSTVPLYGFLMEEEVGYGYDARWVKAYDPMRNEIGPVLMFVWPWSEAIGEEIPRGRYDMWS